MKLLSSLLIGITLSWSMRAEVTLNEISRQLAADYLAKRASSALDFMPTGEQARTLQTQMVELLKADLGPRIGYKVGLVTEQAQKRYQVNAPVRGVLLKKMLIDDGAELPVTFGVAPICEADLIVVVKDGGIQAAKTILDIAEHLTEVVPFMELPDMILATNRLITGRMLEAANVAARLGVRGRGQKVNPTTEFVDALAGMTVTLTDQTGKELGTAQGKVIMGNPLEAALWLVREMNASGEKLEPGDVLSLGSLAAATPKPGQTLTVRYEGLPGGPMQVTARFSE